MPIRAPVFYGLILRKNDRTRQVIIRRFTRGLRDVKVEGLEKHNEDEHLLGVSIALNLHDLLLAIQDLQRAGLQRGRDYIATVPPKGVNGPRPVWLSSMLAPTGNPPELEAKMDPEVREMWERNRETLYFITPGYEDD